MNFLYTNYSQPAVELHGLQYGTITTFGESNLELLMENFVAAQKWSNLESMMESFVAIQSLYNEGFRSQNLHTNEALGQQTTMVESLVTHNKELETKISQLARIPLEPFPERHVNIVTTMGSKQIENYGENDKKLEEISGEEKVEIEKNSPVPPEKEVVKEVRRKYLMLLLLPISRRFLSRKYLWRLMYGL